MPKKFIKYWPSIISAAGAVAVWLTPSMDAYLAKHPADYLLGGIWAVVLHNLKSPRQTP